MNKEFRVGDKVYCPTYSQKVYTVLPSSNDEDSSYPIAVNNETFTADGRFYTLDSVGQLVHANEDNRLLLEKLYGVEFEKPPRELSGNEIVQAMLARGDKYVPCWLSDGHQCPNSAQETDFVTAIADDLSYVTTVTGFEWNYATPFDPRTLEPITELPEPTRRMATLTVPHYNS